MNADASKLPESGTLIGYHTDGCVKTGVIVSYEFVGFFFHERPVYWYANILLSDGQLLRITTNSFIWIHQIDFLK